MVRCQQLLQEAGEGLGSELVGSPAPQGPKQLMLTWPQLRKQLLLPSICLGRGCQGPEQGSGRVSKTAPELSSPAGPSTLPPPYSIGHSLLLPCVSFLNWAPRLHSAKAAAAKVLCDRSQMIMGKAA